MFFNVQEIETKRNKKGYAKELFTGTKQLNDITINTYYYGNDCFERTIHKAYRITLHKAYRENGRVKKKQYVLCTLNYYDIAESYEDDDKDIFSDDILWFTLLGKLDDIVNSFDKTEISSNELENLREVLIDKMYVKLTPLFDNIIQEFKKTEEYRTHEKHRLLIKEYEEAKSKFLKEYNVYSDEYDVCYNFYGNITNEHYLNKIKQRSSAKFENDNHKTRNIYINPNFSSEEREILKKFYRILGKKFHPDANPGTDTTREMQLINKLKLDWEV